MSNTDNLKLPYLAAGQAQKHVTLNESLRMLDAVVQLCLASRTITAPPATPNAGARYLIPNDATGAWSGKTGQIAAWQDGAWAYATPQPGWRAYVVEDGGCILFNGMEWVAEGGAIQPDRLGINTAASPTNRLAVKSSASLFDQEGGDHRLTINKAAAINTASTLFQTNYSGRAEFGLTGSDDFQLKTSPDGAVWANVLAFDKTTGLGVVKANPVSPLGIATKQYVDAQIATQPGGGGGFPAGAIAHFAMNTPPTGWLKANGATVSRTTYAALFAAIGTTYGVGDGSTTFRLPDLRGEFLRGWDDGRGVDGARSLGSAQADAFQGHAMGTDPTNRAILYFQSATPNSGLVGGVYMQQNYLGALLIPQTDGTNGTPRVAAETRPRNIALLACIKT